jgi:hypothetical protein
MNRIELEVPFTRCCVFKELFANAIEFAEICPDVVHLVVDSLVTYLDNCTASFASSNYNYFLIAQHVMFYQNCYLKNGMTNEYIGQLLLRIL